MNKNEQEMRSGERGQALILVMLVLLVVAVLGSAAVTLTASHRQTAARQRNLVQAYYAADAGVERALVIIKSHPTDFWSKFPLENKPLRNEPYAGGEIERVTVKEIPGGPGTGVEITSVGTFNEARKTLVIRMRVFAPGDLLKGVSILPEEQGYELKITGNITLQGPNSNSRPVFLVNGSLEVKRSVDFSGADVYASGEIEGLTGANVHPNYPAIPPFPVLEEEWYRSGADHGYQEDVSFGGAAPGGGSGQGQGQEGQGGDVAEYDGVYFVDGNVEISGTYSGKAVIVATGNIEVTGDLRAEDRDNDLLVLISLNPDGGIDIKNYSVDALIITSGTFSAQGNAQLFGGIIARQLGLKDKETGNVKITCDPELIENNQPFIGERAFHDSSNSPGIKIENWSEQYPVF